MSNELQKAVKKVWSNGWDELLRKTRELRRKYIEDNNEKEIGSMLFKKQIIGKPEPQGRVFGLACKAIDIAIEKIEKEEMQKECDEKNKNLQAQIKDAHLLELREKKRLEGCPPKIDYKDNESIIRDDHTHLIIK